MFLSKRFGTSLAVFLGGAINVFGQSGTLPVPGRPPSGPNSRFT